MKFSTSGSLGLMLLASSCVEASDLFTKSFTVTESDSTFMSTITGTKRSGAESEYDNTKTTGMYTKSFTVTESGSTFISAVTKSIVHSSASSSASSSNAASPGLNVDLLGAFGLTGGMVVGACAMLL